MNFNFRKKYQNIEIIVGTNKLQSGGSRYKIDKPIIHEEFGNPPFSHDLALVRLQSSLQFSDNVKPIKYSKKVVKAGSNLQVSGWGLLWVRYKPLILSIEKVHSIRNQNIRYFLGRWPIST